MHGLIWNKEGVNGHNLIPQFQQRGWRGLFLNPGEGREARCRKQCPEKELGQGQGNVQNASHSFGSMRLFGF